MRKILSAFLLAAGLWGPSLAQDAADVLPDGVEVGASTISACFRPGELQGLDARIDASRVPLPGCTQGLIPPRRDIDASRSYLPGSGDTFDCGSMRERQRNSRQLYRFLRDVVAAAEGQAPACAAGMIRAWAEADAMTGVAAGAAEGPSRLLGMFVTGGLSSVYLIHPEVRAAAGSDGDEVVQRWFKRLATQVAQEIDAGIEKERHTNVLYWQGFSVLPTALMTADPELMRRSRSTFRIALKEATQERPDPGDDGFLPRELRRGEKALIYQVFATQPVVGMAVLSRAYDCDFLDGAGRRDQFVSLVARSIQADLEPAIVAEAAVRLGAAQTAVPQQISGISRSAPDLLYLSSRISPSLADEIDARLARAMGEAPPVVAVAAGASAVNPRMGGSLARLADQADAMADLPAPPRLRKLCGG